MKLEGMSSFMQISSKEVPWIVDTEQVDIESDLVVPWVEESPTMLWSIKAYERTAHRPILHLGKPFLGALLVKIARKGVDTQFGRSFAQGGHLLAKQRALR